jgi:protease I
VVDGNLVSGRTYHDHPHYIPKWMKLLNEERAKRSGGARAATAGAKS